MKRIPIIIISVIVILALAGTVTWLFVSGKLVWAGSGTQQSTAKIICSSEVIDKYNNAAMYIVRGDDATASLDTDGIKNVKTEILAKTGYADDPTCQSLLFLIAAYENNYEDAKTAYESVNAMYEKNIFANSNIQGNYPVSTYASTVYLLSPEYKSQPEPVSE